MNFFAHAVVAAWQSSEPRFVLGAMLPDLVGMAGVRVVHASDPELERGIALHHATDGAFHAAPSFTSLCAEAITKLTAAGVERGTARAVGHVGVELLLDGALSRDLARGEVYRAALAFATEGGLTGKLSTLQPEGVARLAAGLVRLSAAPIPDGYRDPRFVAERLRAILAARPRLAMRPSDFAHVLAWAEVTRERVEDRERELLTQVRAGLA
jgi:hypothetical protein